MTITQAMRAAWHRVNAAAYAEDGPTAHADYVAAWDAWAALAAVQAEQEQLAESITQSRTDRLLHAIYGGPTIQQERSAMRRAYHHKHRRTAHRGQ